MFRVATSQMTSSERMKRYRCFFVRIIQFTEIACCETPWNVRSGPECRRNGNTIHLDSIKLRTLRNIPTTMGLSSMGLDSIFYQLSHICGVSYYCIFIYGLFNYGYFTCLGFSFTGVYHICVSLLYTEHFHLIIIYTELIIHHIVISMHTKAKTRYNLEQVKVKTVWLDISLDDRVYILILKTSRPFGFFN
jgi:hypothetical protein